MKKNKNILAIMVIFIHIGSLWAPDEDGFGPDPIYDPLDRDSGTEHGDRLPQIRIQGPRLTFDSLVPVTGEITEITKSSGTTGTGTYMTHTEGTVDVTKNSPVRTTAIVDALKNLRTSLNQRSGQQNDGSQNQDFTEYLNLRKQLENLLDAVPTNADESLSDLINTAKGAFENINPVDTIGQDELVTFKTSVDALQKAVNQEKMHTVLLDSTELVTLQESPLAKLILKKSWYSFVSDSYGRQRKILSTNIAKFSDVKNEYLEGKISFADYQNQMNKIAIEINNAVEAVETMRSSSADSWVHKQISFEIVEKNPTLSTNIEIVTGKYKTGEITFAAFKKAVKALLEGKQSTVVPVRQLPIVKPTSQETMPFDSLTESQRKQAYLQVMSAHATNVPLETLQRQYQASLTQRIDTITTKQTQIEAMAKYIGTPKGSLTREQKQQVKAWQDLSQRALNDPRLYQEWSSQFQQVDTILQGLHNSYSDQLTLKIRSQIDTLLKANKGLEGLDGYEIRFKNRTSLTPNDLKGLERYIATLKGLQPGPVVKPLKFVRPPKKMYIPPTVITIE